MGNCVGGGATLGAPRPAAVLVDHSEASAPNAPATALPLPAVLPEAHVLPLRPLGLPPLNASAGAQRPRQAAAQNLLATKIAKSAGSVALGREALKAVCEALLPSQPWPAFPIEVNALIASKVANSDLTNFRLVNKAAAQLGTENTQHLVIRSPDRLAEALNTFGLVNGITQLTLKGEGFADAHLALLPSSLHELALDASPEMTPAGLSDCFNRLPQLTKLTVNFMDSSNRLTDEHLAGLPPSLRELTVKTQGFIGGSSAFLERLPHLEKLDIQGARRLGLTDECLARLPHSLRELSAMANTTVTGIGLAHLKRLPCLEKLCILNLSVHGEQFTDGHMAALPPSLRELCLIKAQKITPNGLMFLKTLPQLEKLDLVCDSSSAFTDTHLLVLPPSLQNLSVTGNANITPVGALHLGEPYLCPNLKMLNLSRCNADDRVAEVLARNTKLTSLNLSGNDIRSIGAISLAANTTLAFLDVSGNFMGDTGRAALIAAAQQRPDFTLKLD